MTSQAQINQYFSNHWVGNTNHYFYTHQNLPSKIKNSEWVLDVGCGHNPHKHTIKNLWGIDPAFSEADEQVSIEDFQPQQLFDVAFCLGSINFGKDRSVIERQIAKVVSCLKSQSRIYWRCNPGRNDHGNDQFNSVDVYPWTFEDLARFAEQFGYRITEIAIDRHQVKQDNYRLYAEWTRA